MTWVFNPFTGTPEQTGVNPSTLLHELLSATHTDTLPDSPVAGDLVFANSTPLWARLAKGTANQLLLMDAAGVLPGYRTLAPAFASLDTTGVAFVFGASVTATLDPAIRGLASGNMTATGIVTHQANAALLNDFIVRTIAGTAPIAVADGDGVAGNPTISVTGSALTTGNDTNVTLTAGGSAATSLLAAASITAGWTGQLSVARGGTGLSALGAANTVLNVNSGATALEFDKLVAANCGVTTGSSDTFVFGTSPTFTTDITAPLIYGGSAAGSTLDLRASSAANYTGLVHIGKGAGDYGSTIPNLVSLWSDGLTIGDVAAARAVRMNSTVTQGTTPAGAPALPLISLFANAMTYQPSGTVSALGTIASYYSRPLIKAATSTNVTDGGLHGFHHEVATSVLSTGTLTLSDVAALVSGAHAVGASTTITNSRGLWMQNATGAGTLTNQIAVDVDALAKGGTLNAAVRSAITAAAANFFLQDTGGAQSSFVGKFTKYNNVATDGVGMPSIVKVIDLTTQAAALTGVALWTPSAAGFYRIGVAVTLTRAGTTSTLAGAGGVKINYTTGDGATAKNQQVPLWIPGSTTATVINSATNTVGDTLIGSIVIYSSTTAVTYDVGYASTGGTSMQYAVRIRVEAL